MFITKFDNYDSEIKLKGDCNMADNNMKIGSRRLTKDELKVLLKDYTNIYEQIGSIRENAWELKNKIKNDENYRKIVEREQEFVKHHNNVFSILGDRGSGKSSVLLSIKYNIMKEIIMKNADYKLDSKNEDNIKCNIKNSDTVLPIIVPQDMDDDSESLGWILGFFEDDIEESQKLFLENRNIFNYKMNECDMCDRKRIVNNRLKEAYDRVKESYFKRKRDYQKRLTDVNSDADFVDLKSETLCKDVKLAKHFKIFIDEFINYKKAVSKIKYGGRNEEPLIFIFFDDVDISTKKCIDVLETIIRYLSHSNIVTFVSGNYKTFEETITIKYLEEDGLLNKDLLSTNFVNLKDSDYNKALNVRKRLTYDYLKKVLSPALRYYLSEIEDEYKYRFNPTVKDQKNDSKNLYELIRGCFGLSQDNFMIYKNEKESDGYKMNKFFMAFDNKPRGLINIYYYLNGIYEKINFDKWEYKDRQKFWTKDELGRFLDIIITSNSKLDMYKNEIKSLLSINSDYENNVSIEVDYMSILAGENFNKDLTMQILTLGIFFDALINFLFAEGKYKDIFIQDEKFDEYRAICDTMEKSIPKHDNLDIVLIYKMEKPFDVLYFYQILLKYRFDFEYNTVNCMNYMEYIKKVFENKNENKLADWMSKIIKEKIKKEDLSKIKKSIEKVKNLNLINLEQKLKLNILGDRYEQLKRRYSDYKTPYNESHDYIEMQKQNLFFDVLNEILYSSSLKLSDFTINQNILSLNDKIEEYILESKKIINLKMIPNVSSMTEIKIYLDTLHLIFNFNETNFKKEFVDEFNKLKLSVMEYLDLKYKIELLRLIGLEFLPEEIKYFADIDTGVKEKYLNLLKQEDSIIEVLHSKFNDSNIKNIDYYRDYEKNKSIERYRSDIRKNLFNLDMNIKEKSKIINEEIQVINNNILTRVNILNIWEISQFEVKYDDFIFMNEGEDYFEVIKSAYEDNQKKYEENRKKQIIILI